MVYYLLSRMHAQRENEPTRLMAANDVSRQQTCTVIGGRIFVKQMSKLLSRFLKLKRSEDYEKYSSASNQYHFKSASKQRRDDSSESEKKTKIRNECEKGKMENDER